jgi:excinuclease ABC subunit C
MKENINKKIPKLPGIYKFINQQNKIIYVGKSKNLHNRVRSYFNKNQKNRKVAKMVNEINQISYIISENEHDALLLENNLIKEIKPKYNILLRDDKTFPYIVISKEPYPKIYSSRKINPIKEEVFGPYTNVKGMKKTLTVINKLYKIRNCNLILNKNNIEKKKFKVCLEYHIGNCKGPCAGHQKEKDYIKDIQEIKSILLGKNHNLINNLKEKMKFYSDNLNFENAQKIKEKINTLESYNNKSIIVNHKLKNLDVFGIDKDNFNYYINYMKINNGIILSSETFKTKRKLEDESDSLRQIIFNVRKKYNTHQNNIITNLKLNYSEYDGMKIHYPKAGDKKKLINMSLKNVLFYKKNIINENKIKKSRTTNLLLEIKKKLNLKTIPSIIECFDVSNMQDSNIVASMVSFLNGKPNKKEYRKYKLKNINKSNDYESIKQIVYRRYKRMLKEKTSLPNLIIIDGGKGQLSSAIVALKKLNLYNKINIIGIAKKLEEIYFPNDSIPILLNKKSEHLKFIQKVRNEAHRFAISYHKNLRSKNFIKSELDNIFGIGEKTKFKLLKKYTSIEKIKKIKFEYLAKEIGNKKAKSIIKYLKEKN